MLNPTLTTKDIIIDLDDSGPLDPFPVTCVFQRKCNIILLLGSGRGNQYLGRANITHIL